MIIQNEPKKIAVTEAQMSALRNAYKQYNYLHLSIQLYGHYLLSCQTEK